MHRKGARRVRASGWGISTGGKPSASASSNWHVVFCESEEDARKAQETLSKMLAERGLELSPEKTRIVHITQGFDFLGFNIRHYKTPNSSRSGYKLLITPSKESQKKIRKKLREEWRRMKGAPVGAVIKRLNPIIRGWANYFRIGVSSKVFSKLSNHLHRRQMRYAKHRHPNKSKHWRVRKYWGKIEGRNDKWVFQDKQSGAYMWKFSWIPIRRHVLVKGKASPDDPTLKEYWKIRTAKCKEEKGRYHALYVRQKGKCPVCGQPLNSLEEAWPEEVHIHHVVR